MKNLQRLTILFLSGGVLAVVTLGCMLFTSQERGPLKFEPASLPEAQSGVAYEARVSIHDNATPAGEFSISEGALPPGLKIEVEDNHTSALISGTPEQTGTFTFKVFVWCYGTSVNGQMGEKEYSITVK